MEILGIDVGGSGIKGAPVNLETGELLAERFRVPTPQPATPNGVGEKIHEIVQHFNWNGPIGCGFPAAIRGGVAQNASNIDKKWIGTHVGELITSFTGLPAVALNDADAAGLAEVTFGLGKNQKGVVLMITIGTGLGTSLFIDGKLVPNTELGHIRLKSHGVAEPYASDAARKREDLNWATWAQRFDLYLGELEKLFYPEMFILGGGSSKKFEKFSHLLNTRARIVPARLLNRAGIVGAALAARDLLHAHEHK